MHRRNDTSGSEMRFQYDASSNLVAVKAHGRGLDFAYSDDGLLESVTDTTGRDVLFTYDLSGRLETVSGPPTRLAFDDNSPQRLVTTYTYEAPGDGVRRQLNRRDNVKTITDARNETWLQLNWEAGDGDMGHRVQAQLLGGDSLLFDYLEDNDPRMTVTDRRGLFHVYEHNATGQVVLFRDWDGHETKWKYEVYGGGDKEQGLLRHMELPSGRKVVYTYAKEEEFGNGARVPPITLPNVTKMEQKPGPGDDSVASAYCAAVDTRRNGSGDEITWQYYGHNAWTQLPGETISPAGGVMRNVFDADGRVPSGGGLEVPADGAPAQTSGYTVVRDKTGRITEKIYTDHDGATTTTTYTYDGLETLIPDSTKITIDGAPFTSEVDKDELGRVTRMTEPGGVERTSTYSAVGWLLESCDVVDGVSSCTRYRYNPSGQIIEILEPHGLPGSGEHTATSYTYGDLGQLTETATEVTPGGFRLVERRQYDKNLNVTEIDATGRRPVKYIYGRRNLVERRVTKDDNDADQTEYFTYEEDGQLSGYTNALGHVWQQRYDGYGRAMQTVDPELNASYTAYDAAGRPGEFVECNPDGSPASQQRTLFDAADRVVGRGRLDPNGSSPASWEYFGYDSASNIVLYVDPSGREVSYTYNALQRPTQMVVKGSETGPEVLRVDWGAPDARGHMTSETVTAGGLISETFSQWYLYDGYDRVVNAVDGTSQATSFEYDIRGNLLKQVELSQLGTSKTTTFAYDGLDRPTLAERPDGIKVSYEYGDFDDSSQMVYRDANNRATTYDYDGLGFLRSITYPDGKVESYAYDAGGNALTVTQGDGTELNQLFDKNGRLTSRTIVPAAGLGGHTVEGFTFDGVGRMKTLDQQGVMSTFTYDGMSRLRSESTAGLGFSTSYDASGLRSQVSYPSSEVVREWYGDSGQLQKVFVDKPSVEPGLHAQYGYLGTLKRAMVVGNSSAPVAIQEQYLEQVLEYDANQRVASSRVQGHQDTNVLLHEILGRDGRGLITEQNYEDRGGQGWTRTYDDAGRLLSQAAGGFSSGGAAEPGGYFGTSIASDFAFSYDTVDHLTSRTEVHSCSSTTDVFTPDASGRNRLASFNSSTLVYDDNGYLKQKGDLHFTYDYLGRLIKVERQSGGTTTVLALYGYDGLNRRITRTVGGSTWRTAWDGWRPVEEYLEGAAEPVLMSRRIYGAGLDEIIGLQVRPTAASAELTDYLPLYDQVGNLVVLAGVDGKPVERYDYTPNGQRYIWSDQTPPTVEQVLFQDGKVIVELSEEVLPEKVDQAMASSLLTLYNSTKQLDIGLTVSRPVATGRNARQRLVFTLEDPEEPEDRDVGDVLQLTLPAAAFEDFFGHAMASDPVVPDFTFATSGTEVVLDTASPELVHACIVGGKLRLEFSETPDAAAAATAIELDGAGVAWTLLADGYTLEMTTAMPGGAHSLSFTANPLDLAAKPVTSAGAIAFDGGDHHVWSGAFPGEVGIVPGEYAARSAAGNPFGFKGLMVDPETGFYYVRNRYYDPELGRFLTPDPLGYADSANVYQFALNDPANMGDPTGLYAEAVIEAASIGAGLVSLKVNATRGNWKWVAWDLVGLTVDTAALAVPGVPGFAGLGVKAYRAAELGYDTSRIGVALRARLLTCRPPHHCDVRMTSYQQLKNDWLRLVHFR
ncbi:MAG: RHS repeat-associated core domain-containing protein [Acidobacteriota bacterium]